MRCSPALVAVAAGVAGRDAVPMALGRDAGAALDARRLRHAVRASVGAARRAQRVAQPLRSLANMLEALREGDYTMRGRNIDPEDAMGEVMVEVNTLSRTLHDQRLEALEAGALLQKVIADVDIAVFGFDSRPAPPAREPRGRDAARQHRRRAARAAARPSSASRAMLDEASGRIVEPRVPRRAPAAGRFAAAASARAAGRTSCSSSRISRARCATKSARRGSGSCA